MIEIKPKLLTEMVIDETILLGDNCYSDLDLYQEIDLLPGKYYIYSNESNDKSEHGARVYEFACIHEDHVNDYLDSDESYHDMSLYDTLTNNLHQQFTLGSNLYVDSGTISLCFKSQWKTDDESFYAKMPNWGLSLTKVGSYFATTSTGYGDGVYYPYIISDINKQKIGFIIDFIDANEAYDPGDEIRQYQEDMESQDYDN